MKLNVLYGIALSGVVSLASCAEGQKKNESEDTPAAQTEMTEEKAVENPNIVEVAVGDERFSTLVTAVKAAGLVETLSGEGPFTVFAPINDAFASLPEGTLDNLLKPENKAALQGVLTYHVVAGKFEAAAVVEAINNNNGSLTLTTVQGQELTAALEDGKVVLTDANGGKATVILTDVGASNGVIHAIDTVVLPASE